MAQRLLPKAYAYTGTTLRQPATTASDSEEKKQWLVSEIKGTHGWTDTIFTLPSLETVCRSVVYRSDTRFQLVRIASRMGTASYSGHEELPSRAGRRQSIQPNPERTQEQ